MDAFEDLYLALQPRIIAEDDAGGQVEIPQVIAWESLPPDEYRERLAQLADWVQWLIDTYRWPPTVVPSCWFLHPDMVEDLGHLHTSWLFSRHPNTNIGPAGSDWDARRDAAEQRLTRMVQVAGCGSSRGHQARQADRRVVSDAALLSEHLRAQAEWRSRAEAHVQAADHHDQVAAAIAAATDRVLGQEEERRVERQSEPQDADALTETAALRAARAAATKTEALLADARKASLVDAQGRVADLFTRAHRAAIANNPEATPAQVRDALSADPALLAAIEAWSRELDATQ